MFVYILNKGIAAECNIDFGGQLYKRINQYFEALKFDSIFTSQILKQ